MKLTFLGTGTSVGVPQIGCRCRTCTSTDARDKRLRCSALVEADSGERLLIDVGPDFREQILRVGSPGFNALLITHIHYDHVGGVDDLRPYCHPDRFPVYCLPDVADDLRQRVPYCFYEHLYPGVPTFNIHEISPEKPFAVGSCTVQPLPVMHGRLPIIGFRIGPLAYITDCKTLPEHTYELLRGVDTLVINALRRKEHPTHMRLDEALGVIERVGPRRSWLIHLSHDMGLHAEVEPTLPEGVHLAYDGLTIEIP